MKVYRHNSRRPSPSLLACALASCLLVSTPQVLAQTANANLRGQVMVDSAPAAGTEVIATNVNTGAVRRAQTNANGGYTLIGLPPGTYRVEAGGATARRSRCPSPPTPR